MGRSSEPKPLIERTDIGSVTVVRIASRGFLDFEDSQLLGQALYDLVDQEQRGRIVVNLEAVDAPSSSFIGKLLWLIIKARKLGGRVALCRLGDSLRRVFQPLPMQEPGEAIGFFDDEEQARLWAAEAPGLPEDTQPVPPG